MPNRLAVRRLVALLVTWLAGACIAAPFDSKPSGLPDGAECERDQDCRSHGCNHNRLCAHSACDCPGDTCTEGGEVSADCQAGWLCVYYSSVLSGVGNFFGVEGDPDGGTCQPTCDPACPEHYHCTGRLCAADPDWADPIPTVSWSGAAEGTLSGAGRTTTVKLERGNTVTLTATAQSPVDVAVTKFAWNIVGDSGERSMLEAMSVDVTLDSDSYRRVELSVGDAEARSAELTVILESCSGPGTACGYQGSGCCNECDAQNKFCL